MDDKIFRYSRRSFIKKIPYLLSLSYISFNEDKNENICNEKFKYAQKNNLSLLPINLILVEIAKTFIGVDYKSDTLEINNEEKLVVNLQYFDCVTFYETCLALARAIKKKSFTYESFKKELQFLRYRDGIINKYSSRLHYTSDYFFDNQKKRTLKDVTLEIGGIVYKKHINFMSENKHLYKTLMKNPQLVFDIEKIENEINTRTLYHIPKNKSQAFANIKDGDILGITTNIPGIDCSHTGIAIWQKSIKRELFLLHAPAPNKKIQITQVPLKKYLDANKNHAGVMVARALEPK